jgi:mannitol/fructose-specific phosphotransferase system IIA component (Ntr-type)
MPNCCAIQEAQIPDRGPDLSTVAAYTEPSLMVPRVRSRDPEALTAELASALQCRGRISDVESFCHAVITHERLSSTAMSPGWALPHARLAGIPQLAFALGRTAKPLLWFGGQPVSTVFLCAVPENEAAAYLGLISALAKLSQDPKRLLRLESAPDSRAMFEVLREIPLSGKPAAAGNT